MNINHDELEDWGLRAAQALQDIVDECEQSEGYPGGGKESCADLRALLDEHSRIQRGEPAWQAMIGSEKSDVELKL